MALEDVIRVKGQRTMEFLEFVFVAIIVYYGSKALWVSTLIIEERKKNYRAGTHDYYGNKIEKDEENG
tara:strand:- start:315 stop:518 length:204 start_codon:yes stop_codon:yes gene_type:complete